MVKWWAHRSARARDRGGAKRFVDDAQILLLTAAQSDGVLTRRTGFNLEIRNPNSETRRKFECGNDQNVQTMQKYRPAER
jgi:hypothetical protein